MKNETNNAEEMYENRAELEDILIGNGEYADGLKEWLEDAWEGSESPKSECTDDEIEEIEAEWEKEYAETEWSEYVDKMWATYLDY